MLFAAPLKRTLETAAAIASQQKNQIDILSEVSLLEIDYGPDEGKPEADVVARIGEAAVKKWNDAAVPPSGWDVNPADLTDAWRALFSRVAALGADAVALAVTSNGVARFALDAATSADPAFPKKLRTGAFGRIDIRNDHAKAAEWNVRP